MINLINKLMAKKKKGSAKAESKPLVEKVEQQKEVKKPSNERTIINSRG